MQKKRENAILWVGSVFTISATVGQVISISDLWIKLAILIPNLIVWVYFIWVYLTYKPPLPSSSTIKELGISLQTSEVTFRYVRSETELDYVWNIDNIIYGSFNISKQTLYEWYYQYKFGTLMMFKGSKFLGYIGIYPLNKTSFDKLKKGELKEDKIGEKDICSDNEAQQCNTWYFSGYALYEQSLFRTMVAEALKRWSDLFRDNDTIEAVSFSYPGSDEEFLEEIGFIKIKEKNSITELPIVYRTFDKAEVIHLAKSLGKTG